jgi:hypothetical protein
VQSFVIKRADTMPALAATLEDASGAVNLAGATVQFRLASTVSATSADGCVTYSPGPVLFTKSAVVTDAANGAVKYNWSTGDAATVGYFLGEFIATFADGSKQTFPTSGFIPVVVNAALS